MKQVFIKQGEFGRAEMPYSEVCCHMRVAGKVMDFHVTKGRYPMAQLLDSEGRNFSGAITLGEAGIYSNDGDMYYYVAEPVAQSV